MSRKDSGSGMRKLAIIVVLPSSLICVSGGKA